ncbi:MAG: DUF1428 domain-containing protein [Phycisphaerales bacterium]
MAKKSKSKTGYVDGFVLVIPTKKMAAYKKMAEIGCKVWMDHGALAYAECVGEDMKVPFGVAFPKFANAKKSETVVFSFITYKNKAHRDSVNKKVMSDERLKAACDPKNMPFDMKKMTYGGFEVFVGA